MLLHRAGCSKMLFGVADQVDFFLAYIHCILDELISVFLNETSVFTIVILCKLHVSLTEVILL